MDLQGQTLADRYVVGEQLGEGADAVIYRAEDRLLDRTVALKVLRQELRADPTFVARFEREAQGAARLDHPHIVPIYDHGTADGPQFIVMPYVGGGDLRARLQGEALSVDQSVRIATEVAEALGAAHAQGIIHRDVKPANILLTEDGHAVVTDFGIAKMLDVPALTATAALLGTPHYLAPEQASGSPITPATDVYALGIVLFEMLAGRRPFDGENFIQVALQHLHAPTPSLADVRPDMPAELAALVARALAKDPAERFADGAALAVRLREQEEALIARGAAVGVQATAELQAAAHGTPGADAAPADAAAAAPGKPASTPAPSVTRFLDGAVGAAAASSAAVTASLGASSGAPSSGASADTPPAWPPAATEEVAVPPGDSPPNGWRQATAGTGQRAAYAIPMALVALLGLGMAALVGVNVFGLGQRVETALSGQMNTAEHITLASAEGAGTGGNGESALPPDATPFGEVAGVVAVAAPTETPEPTPTETPTPEPTHSGASHAEADCTGRAAHGHAAGRPPDAAHGHEPAGFANGRAAHRAPLADTSAAHRAALGDAAAATHSGADRTRANAGRSGARRRSDGGADRGPDGHDAAHRGPAPDRRADGIAPPERHGAPAASHHPHREPPATRARGRVGAGPERLCPPELWRVCAHTGARLTGRPAIHLGQALIGRSSQRRTAKRHCLDQGGPTAGCLRRAVRPRRSDKRLSVPIQCFSLPMAAAQAL